MGSAILDLRISKGPPFFLNVLIRLENRICLTAFKHDFLFSGRVVIPIRNNKQVLTPFMKKIIRSCISQVEIAAAVEKLAARISRDYTQHELIVIGVLTGSIVFVADLMRQISIPHQIGMIQASSYRGKATSPGELQINLDFLPEIQNRDVLLVDDIFDTGRTLSVLVEQLKLRQPKSIRSAVLLWKTARRQVSATPDYHCFEIPDEFVVGYGLDFEHQYRHLPYLGVLEQASSGENPSPA